MRKAVTMRRGEPRYLPDPDEPTDAARALAVLDRLWERWPDGELNGWRRLNGQTVVRFTPDGRRPREHSQGHGDTPAAALLALGARVEEGA